MEQSNKLILWGIGAVGLGLLLRKAATKPLGELGLLLAEQPYTQVSGSIDRIVGSLSSTIAQASALTGTPSKYIVAIAAYEIGFRPFSFINPAVKATGVMQITPPTMFDVYYFADKFKLVKPELTAFLRRKMTASDYSRFISLAKNRQANEALALRYLKDAEFNVVLGALLLRVLMYWFTENGQINLARLVVGYNRGVEWARKNLLAKVGISAEQLQREVPGEAKKYIANQLGRNGYMEFVHQANM